MRGVLDTWIRSAIVAATLIGFNVRPCAAEAAENPPATEKPATPLVRCTAGERLVDQHCITDPVLLKHRPAKYPPDAMASRTEASVTVKTVIAENGRVTDAVVEACTNPGHGFEDAAIEAVRKRRYKPAKIDGKVTAVTSRVVIDFKL
jgi:protein TonB